MRAFSIANSCSTSRRLLYGASVTTEPTSYFAGGYFLTRPAERTRTGEVVLDQLITVCNCLTYFAFEHWWDVESAEKATDLGVEASRIPEVAAWYSERFGSDFGFPNVAYSTAVIREFCDEFNVDRSGLVILGCGFDDTHRQILLDEFRAPANTGENGIIELLDRRKSLDEQGHVLGFEIMSFDLGLDHSWVCYDFVGEAETQLGIQVDPGTGLLRTLDDAQSVANHINSLPPDKGAYGYWLPIQITSY